MSYYYKKYEWTAYTEADLLGAGTGGSIGYGDTFHMPGAATVHMSTWDNDGSLSGDNYHDENANDWSGQNAYVDGGRVGGQLYAESYHVLRGSDDKHYYMIEIEVEGYDAPGAGDDFFTFYGRVPPAGTQLTVVQTCNVTGCWVDYRCLGAGEKAPPNTPPEFTNVPDLGKICIDENTTFVIDLDAEDADGDALTYEIVGGADASFFQIDAHSGELSFVAPPDYEAPADHGADNVYEVKVKVSDGKGGSDQQLLKVCVNDVDEPGGGECIVIEAEDMHKWGFHTVWGGSGASGGKLVKLDCAGGWGKLWTNFDGPAGTYDLKLHVQDEYDGQSSLTIKVNGHVVGTIKLDRDSDGAGSNHGPFSEFVLEDIQINPGDKISIWANGNCWEYVRIDKIELCKDDVVLGSIGDRVWFDADGDGVQGAGEAGVAGVTVNLIGAGADGVFGTGDDEVLATQSTDADGNYLFEELAAGDYKVSVDLPSGDVAFTTPDVGIDDDADSDVDASGLTGVISLAEGENRTDVDAGLVPLGSIGDRVWFDADGNGRQDAGEAGVDGVAVTLFDGQGNQVANTTTANGGTYLFTGLAAGTYFVDFAAADTFEFTTANAGGVDDAEDSDADQVTGQTGAIVLGVGENNLTVDAGLVAANTPPEPQPDAAKTCADEEKTVDVLDNDSDPDGDTLTIVAVDGQAIVEGQTILTSVGTSVTLSGGQLVVDGSVSWDALDIGESEVEQITYTVADGNGGEASSFLDMTFCGDANSVQSLCDSLPESVDYQVRASGIELPVEPYAFDLLITGTGDARFDGVVFEQAYCLSLFDPADGAEAFADAPINIGAMFCSTEATDDLFNADQTSFANGLSAFENLDLVNWMLNQDFEDNGFTGWEVQRAIWELTDSLDTDYQSDIDPGFGDDANVDFLVQQALDFGEGFVAGVGDKIGVIIDPDPATPENSQPFIIAMDFETYDCLC